MFVEQLDLSSTPFGTDCTLGVNGAKWTSTKATEKSVRRSYSTHLNRKHGGLNWHLAFHMATKKGNNVDMVETIGPPTTWSCNHCTTVAQKSSNQVDVMIHIRAKHADQLKKATVAQPGHVYQPGHHGTPAKYTSNKDNFKKLKNGKCTWKRTTSKKTFTWKRKQAARAAKRHSETHKEE